MSLDESDTSNSAEKIILHKARLITDENGYIFDKEILNEITIDCVVRISLIVPENPHYLWSHDAPYISIKRKENNLYLGEVLPLNRDINCNKYPLATGEKVWFGLDNIIEIPTKQQSKNKAQKFKQFLTKNTVTITGPLYTVIYEDSDFSESDCDSYSDASSHNE